MPASLPLFMIVLLMHPLHCTSAVLSAVPNEANKHDGTRSSLERTAIR
jgi:hypothetical protein